MLQRVVPNPGSEARLREAGLVCYTETMGEFEERSKGVRRGNRRRIRKPAGIRTNWIREVFIYASLLLVMGFVSHRIYADIADTRAKLAVLGETNDEVVKLRNENLKLHVENSRISSDAYLEKEVRDKLHYVRDGENVFIIDERALTSDALDKVYRQILGERDTPPPPHGVSVWWDWLHGKYTSEQRDG